MELPHLGKRCGVVECGQLDFLPIHCGGCGGDFCKHHSTPALHSCLAEKTQQEEAQQLQGKENVCVARYQCQVEGCRGGELTPVQCLKCAKNYCLAHRHQADHSCPALAPPDSSTQAAAAAAHIKQITHSMKGGEGVKGQGRRSEQLAAKVQLMKLKQKAIGEKGIPQEDRIYLLVFLPKPSSSSSSSSSSMPVFISRHWTIGKAVDVIASLAKLNNNNNITGAPKLHLFEPTTGGAAEGKHHHHHHLHHHHHHHLASTLHSGQSVILDYVAEVDTL